MMRVMLIDQSNFTLPYDQHLCTALAKLVDDLVFVCRPFRQDEQLTNGDYKVLALFYKVTENMAGYVQKNSLFRIFKATEHLPSMIRLLWFVRSWRPNIIHFQWSVFPLVDELFVRIMRQYAPVILTVHDSTPFHGNPSTYFQSLGWPRLFRTCDHLIVHTQFTKTRLVQRGVSPAKINIIPLGIINLRSVNTRKQSGFQVTSGCSLKLIVFWGTIKPYKGVDVLIKSLAYIPRHYRENLVVRIVGKPYVSISEMQNLAIRLNVSDHIHWDLRFVPEDELAYLLSSAYVVVFPYRDIDASAALMTTLPFGKPIVASRIGGFPEILEDGKHGYLVPPEDPVALAAALTKLLANPELCQWMGEQVRLLADSIPSWDKIAQDTAKVYEQVIYERRRGS